MLLAQPASAHARWFLLNEPAIPSPPLVLDRITGLLLLATFCLIAFALLLEKLASDHPEIQRLMHAPVRFGYDLDWRILSAAFGSSLIISSMALVFVAPNLPLGSGILPAIVAFLQIVLGAMFVLQSWLLLAGIATFLLPLACWWMHSFSHAIDYAFELAGIGAALFLVAPLISTVDKNALASALRNLPANSRVRFATPDGTFELRLQAAGEAGRTPHRSPEWREQRLGQAAGVLRVMLGLQLVALSAHDKLIYPGVSLAFVEQYPFVNFVALLGMTSFTNLHFVVGAGLIEMTLGSLLIANIATRPACALLLAVFTLTGLVFGIHELVGHVPIIAALLLLGAAGSPAPERPGLQLPGSILLHGAMATAGLIIVVAFIANAPRPGNIGQRIDGATVPAALYTRFDAAPHGATSRERGLERADAAVRAALASAVASGDVDKDDLARRMFELSIRYEGVHGRDAASLWLRYAHLATTCTPDDLAFFRALVANPGWADTLARAPKELNEVLAPIARQSAATILGASSIPPGGRFWEAAARSAPSSGPGYVHTHTLAVVARIIHAASVEKISGSASSLETR